MTLAHKVIKIQLDSLRAFRDNNANDTHNGVLTIYIAGQDLYIVISEG
jgi:hypothetical protein